MVVVAVGNFANTMYTLVVLKLRFKAKMKRAKGRKDPPHQNWQAWSFLEHKDAAGRQNPLTCVNIFWCCRASSRSILQAFVLQGVVVQKTLCLLNYQKHPQLYIAAKSQVYIAQMWAGWLVLQKLPLLSTTTNHLNDEQCFTCSPALNHLFFTWSISSPLSSAMHDPFFTVLNSRWRK